MNQSEIDWEQMALAMARRDQGIASSAQHAEQDVPGWGEQALASMRKFASKWWDEETDGFTMEECRNWCTHWDGLSEPEELRSWGAVTQKAIRQGIIKKTGEYAPAASSNGSPKPLYVGCV